MTRLSPDFDRHAALYESHAPVQRDAAAWLAEWLPPHVDGQAIEFGAGTGFFTRHLAPIASALSATDIAPRMIEVGRQALPEVSWELVDASSPLFTNRFQWVFTCSLAQWLASPDVVFSRWRKACTPGARLLGGWFVRGTLEDLYSVCPDASPFPWRDQDEWVSILKDAGWTTLRAECRHFTRHHADAASMLRQIHNAGAMIPRRMSTARLRHALRQLDESTMSNHGITSTFSFMRIEAHT